MRTAAADGDAFGNADAHRRFHTELVALARQRQLLLAYTPILVRLQLHMAVNLRREAQARAPLDGVRRHEVLLAAVESEDVERVLAALADHGAQTSL
jgi:DNA-binding GntR family transcriptional regulator